MKKIIKGKPTHRLIHDQVMRRIKQEHIGMRPHWHFVMGSILLGVGMAGTIVVAGFFIHVALFRLRLHEPLAYLMLGRLGWRFFLLLFPWVPLIVAVGGLWGGAYLLRRFDLAYRKSFVGLVIALVAMVLALGWFFERVELGQRVMRIGQMRRLYQNELRFSPPPLPRRMHPDERKLPLQLYYRQ